MGIRKGKEKGANEEDNDVNADDIPAALRETVQRLKDMFLNRSEQDIYATLVECNMKVDLAIERLRSQERERSQEVESNQGEQKETTDASESCPQGVDSSIQNSELGNSGDHDVGQGGENKLNSDETSTEQGTSNQLANSSTTSSKLVSYKGDLTNVEPESVPISSGKAVPSVRRPPRIISPDTIMADVLKRSLGLSSKESVTEAPVKDDSPLHEKPDATNPSSNSFTESDAARDQLGESASVYDYNLTDDEDVLKRSLALSSKESVTEAPVKDDSPLHEKPDATNPSSNSFTESDAARDQLGESAPVYDYKLPDDEEVTNPINYAPINFAARSDQLQESASEPNLQMHNLYTSPDAMHQQPYTGEPDPNSTLPFNQSMPTGQSIPTASALDRRPSISMTEAFINSTSFEPQRNQQDMNRYYSQRQVPSGQYGTMMNSPYWRPNQNESYNMPPSPAFQQRGGSNNNTLAHNTNLMNSPYSRPTYNDSYNMPPSAAFQQQGGSNNSTYHHQSLDSVFPQYRNSNLDWPTSFRHSQQEQQPSTGIGYERSSAYYTSQNQQINRSDPSDQTQQPQWRRDNH